METDLKKFGLTENKFINTTNLTHNFYKNLDSLYNLADLSKELKNSYGDDAIREIFNQNPSYIKNLDSSYQKAIQGIKGELLTGKGPEEINYLKSNKFIEDTENLKKIFPSDLVKTGKNINPSAINKKLPNKGNLTVKQLLDKTNSGKSGPYKKFVDYMLPTSLETGRANYKYDYSSNRRGELSLSKDYKKIQYKDSTDILKGKYYLNGKEIEAKTSVSILGSIEKKFGIEAESKISGLPNEGQFSHKSTFDLKDGLGQKSSFSNKFFDVSSSINQNEAKIESKLAVSKSIKVGGEVGVKEKNSEKKEKSSIFELTDQNQEQEQNSSQENDYKSYFKLKSKLDLKSATLGEVAAYATLVKPFELMSNMFLEMTQEDGNGNGKSKNLGVENAQEQANIEKIGIVESYQNLSKSGLIDSYGEGVLSETYQKQIDNQINNMVELGINTYMKNNL